MLDLKWFQKVMFIAMTSFQLKIAGQTRNQDTMTRDQEKQKRSERDFRS